jgi:hypothetical protein
MQSGHLMELGLEVRVRSLALFFIVLSYESWRMKKWASGISGELGMPTLSRISVSIDSKPVPFMSPRRDLWM